MTVFGKLLLFFNLLLVGGVAFLSTQSWTQRQSQNAAALRNYMVLEGLPMEENTDTIEKREEEEDPPIPFTFQMPGGNKVTSVRTNFLKAHFQGTESPLTPDVAPTSRVAELKAVQSKLQAALAAKRPVQMLAFLVGTINETTQDFTPGLLTYLANSYDERVALKQLLVRTSVPIAERNAKETANAKAAENLLMARFNALLSPPVPNAAAAEKKPIDDASEAFQKAEKALAAAYATRKTALDAAQKAAVDYEQDRKSAELKEISEKTEIDFQKTIRMYDDARKAWTKTYDDLGKAVRDSGVAAPFDETDRRIRLATLLMHLDFDAPTDGWQKRVALVVGLPDYLEAIRERTRRIQSSGGYMASIRNQRDQVEVRFAETYVYLQSTASYRDYLLEAQQKITRSLVEQAVKEVEETKQQKSRWEVEKKDLEETIKKVNDAVAEQDAIENDLFQVQKRVGRMLRSTFELEDRIESAERARFGLRPR